MKIFIVAVIALLLTSCSISGLISVQPTTIYYGMGLGVPSNGRSIKQGNVRTIESFEYYSVPFTGNVLVNYWVAEPISEPAKTISYNGMFREPIGENQTFNVKTVFGYRIYYTTNLTQLSTTTFYIK